MFLRKLVIVVFALTLSCFAQDPCGSKPQVLVVGMYHMANPGRPIL